MSTDTVEPTAVPKTPEEQANIGDLSLAAEAIFNKGVTSVFLPSLGRKLVIHPASMKHLPLILEFFRSAMDGMDQEMMGALVDMVADSQRKTMAAGSSPSSASVEDLATVELVHKAFGNVNLLAMLASSVLNVLPRIVTAFTEMTESEFGELPPDEGLLIAGGVFMVNYSFFTQSLPPILTAFMRSWASKNALAIPPAGKKIVKRR